MECSFIFWPYKERAPSQVGAVKPDEGMVVIGGEKNYGVLVGDRLPVKKQGNGPKNFRMAERVMLGEAHKYLWN